MDDYDPIQLEIVLKSYSMKSKSNISPQNRSTMGVKPEITHLFSLRCEFLTNNLLNEK
jgi:hypothetical protein